MNELLEAVEDWQILYDAQEELIDRVLERNESLRDELSRTRRELEEQQRRAESEQKARVEKSQRKRALEGGEEAKERAVEERQKLEAAIDRLKGQNDETRRLLHEKEQRLRVVRARSNAALSPSPFVLVLVNAAIAPWNEAFVRQGHEYEGGEQAAEALSFLVQQDLQLHPLTPSSLPSAIVLSFFFLNPEVLADNLVQSFDLTSPSLLESFLAGFMTGAGNNIVDTRDAPINPKIGTFIRRFAEMDNLKRIYLAGVPVEEFQEVLAELPLPIVSFLAAVDLKLSMVDVSTTPSEHQDFLASLTETPWSSAVFPGFFAEHTGLAHDTEFTFRPPSPFVGPGDQNHEDDADENGFTRVEPRWEPGGKGRIKPAKSAGWVTGGGGRW